MGAARLERGRFQVRFREAWPRRSRAAITRDIVGVPRLRSTILRHRRTPSQVMEWLYLGHYC